jgi:hypothetical protein
MKQRRESNSKARCRGVLALLLTACCSLLALSACRGSLSPLSNRLAIGQDAYVVFTADGEDGLGDLFASAAAGGKVFQVTFTRLDERAPALSRDGAMLAFLRSRAPDDTTGMTAVVMNLVNGAERSISLPHPPAAVAWSHDGTTLFFTTAAGIYQAPAPPARGAAEPVPADRRAAADSAFRVPLGDPAVGEALPCDAGPGLCARLANGATTVLSTTGVQPVWWGSDSVAYREEGEYVVRPLGGGRTRSLHWASGAAHPRDLTYFPGVATVDRGPSP